MALREAKIATAPWVNAPGQWEEGALRWNFYDLNMMGDVAVSPWHDEPFEPMVELEYGEEYPSNMTSMKVTVTDNNGVGLKNFRCSLFHGLDLQGLVGVAYTDENGEAIIEINDNLMAYAHMQLIVTGCDAWPQTITLGLIGTEENPMSNVSLYPNPNKGQFTLNLPEEDCEITVFNSLGQEVYHSTAQGRTVLNFESLTNGVYFVNVKAESAVRTLKFVKE